MILSAGPCSYRLPVSQPLPYNLLMLPPSPAPRSQDQRHAFHVALRMLAYPGLAVLLGVNLFYFARSREAFHYASWQLAEDEAARAEHFAALQRTRPAEERMAAYWGLRAWELVECHKWQELRAELRARPDEGILFVPAVVEALKRL